MVTVTCFAHFSILVSLTETILQFRCGRNSFIDLTRCSLTIPISRRHKLSLSRLSRETKRSKLFVSNIIFAFLVSYYCTIFCRLIYGIICRLALCEFYGLGLGIVEDQGSVALHHGAGGGPGRLLAHRPHGVPAPLRAPLPRPRHQTALLPRRVLPHLLPHLPTRPRPALAPAPVTGHPSTLQVAFTRYWRPAVSIVTIGK